MKTASHKLALLAIVLGIVALLGEPQAGGSVRLNTQELAYIVEGKIDHVDVEELADWIVQGRSDYRLIDVRADEDYASYHIPTAENVRLVEFGDYPLYRNEKIVLYSDGGIHAAQAWFCCRPRATKIAIYCWVVWNCGKMKFCFRPSPKTPAPARAPLLRKGAA